MPRDETTYRFSCEICGDRFESSDRAEAHAAAAACEGQGVEVAPLPVGTSVLVLAFVPDTRKRAMRIEQIADAQIGSGRYQNGKGHQLHYRLAGRERPDVRPREVHPHLPGQLNTLVVPYRDTRSIGERLNRIGFHSGGRGEADTQLVAAAELIGRLAGEAPEVRWLATVFGAEIGPRHWFPMLPPRGHLSPELLAAVDTLARPITITELPDDFYTSMSGIGTEAMRFTGDEARLKPRFPNPYPAAWAYSLEVNERRLAQARAFMLCHRDDLPALLRARSAAWWAGDDVSLPAQLLLPAEGTKTGAMTAGQSAALDGIGDVQREPRRRSSYAAPPEWREGAIQVLSMPPTRMNMKTPRYRPVDALAGIAGHHPEIRSLSLMPGSTLPAVPVICVASGKGGVGKSTVAAALAMALTRAGTSATLLDLDLEGPSLPALLDLPAAQADGERITPHELSDGTRVFSPGQLWPGERALTWETATLEAMVHFLAGALDLGDSQVLVVDLPPGTPPVQLLVNHAWQPRGTVLVTTGSRVAHADLRRAFAAAANPLGVVENLTRAEVTIDGRVLEARLYDGASTEDLAREIGTSYLGSLPHRPEPSDLAVTDEMTAIATLVTQALADLTPSP